MGEVGDGFKVAMSALDSGRYSVAAGCVGICEGCVEASVAYAKERRQFDGPLARFQLVQEMIADMIVRRDAARMLVRRAGLLKDAGKPSTVETSVAKLYATEASVECANLAIQVHGGSGYVDDYPVERYLRDARVTTLYEGTSQIQKLIIGRDATGINAMPVAALAARCRPAVAELVETSVDGQVGLCRLNRPEARNALSPELMEELASAVEAFDTDPRGALHRDRRLRPGLRRRRRHRGARRARVPRGRLSPRRRLLAPAGALPHAADRRGLGLGAGRRLRAGARLRPDRRLRDGRVRPARDHARDHPRRRRHAAAGAGGRQAAGDGARPHRATVQRR